jgi:hypothetical protein
MGFLWGEKTSSLKVWRISTCQLGAVCEEVMLDMDERPNNESLFERHKRAINQLFPNN